MKFTKMLIRYLQRPDSLYSYSGWRTEWVYAPYLRQYEWAELRIGELEFYFKRYSDCPVTVSIGYHPCYDIPGYTQTLAKHKYMFSTELDELYVKVLKGLAKRNYD